MRVAKAKIVYGVFQQTWETESYLRYVYVCDWDGAVGIRACNPSFAGEDRRSLRQVGTLSPGDELDLVL